MGKFPLCAVILKLCKDWGNPKLWHKLTVPLPSGLCLCELASWKQCRGVGRERLTFRRGEGVEGQMTQVGAAAAGQTLVLGGNHCTLIIQGWMCFFHHDLIVGEPTNCIQSDWDCLINIHQKVINLVLQEWAVCSPSSTLSPLPLRALLLVTPCAIS